MKYPVMSVCFFILAFNVQAEEDIWGNSDTLDDETQATLNRHMAKSRAIEGKMTAEQRREFRKQQRKSGCGGIKIGEVAGAKGDVNNTVIIRGDVINANNNCK